ncbi:MAG: hypothetical protein NC102_06240 [Clostridium sp.]|nr:hypothetical protein [Clostridium sp.]
MKKVEGAHATEDGLMLIRDIPDSVEKIEDAAFKNAYPKRADNIKGIGDANV